MMTAGLLANELTELLVAELLNELVASVENAEAGLLFSDSPPHALSAKGMVTTQAQLTPRFSIICVNIRVSACRVDPLAHAVPNGSKLIEHGYVTQTTVGAQLNLRFTGE